MPIVKCLKCGSEFDDKEFQIGLTRVLPAQPICTHCGTACHLSLDEIVKRAREAKKKIDEAIEGRATEDHTMLETVYFIGAGFSKAAGVPLVSEFCPEAKDSLRTSLMPTDNTLADLVARWETLRSLSPTAYADLEDVFNDALREYNEKPTPEATEVLFTKLPDAICKVIYDTCGMYTANNIWNRAPDNLYIKFFDGVIADRPDSVAFITTNYDPLIEFSILGLGKHNVEFAIRKVIRPFYPERSLSKRSVTVLKLHGSTSWAICSSPACPAHQSQSIFARGVDPRWLPVSFGAIPLPCPVCREHKLRTLLVPPARGKELRFAEVFERISHRAREALSAAHRWIFVGFALNPYDTHLDDEFFTPSLEGRQDIDIVVVDPSQQVLERFAASFRDRVRSLKLHRKTFAEALEAEIFFSVRDVIAEDGPLDRNRPEFPERTCVQCGGSTRLPVKYDCSHIDEDDIETRRFRLQCSSCDRDIDVEVPVSEPWRTRGARLQETPVGKVLERGAGLVGVSPTDILSTAAHYEPAKDIIMHVGLGTPPDRGFPLVVHVREIEGLESAASELSWAELLIIRFSVGPRLIGCTLASEIKDSWSYTVVSRLDWAPEVVQFAVSHKDEMMSGRLFLQVHDYEYFTLAAGGSFVHGGPALSTFPRRPFAVLVSQRFGWRDMDLEVDQVRDGGEELAWDSLRELCGDNPVHELARLVAKVSELSAGHAVELDSLHAQLCSAGESSSHRRSVGPHVRLTWEPPGL